MSQVSLSGKNLLSLLDFTTDEVREILDTAAQLRANPHRYTTALSGKTLFMYFEKPSLRTRVTFETGMTQLGGHAIYYTANEGRIGERESVADVARNLERWVDGAMCRTFSHAMLAELAAQSTIPVINGLTDFLHPCQALADFQTLAQVKGPVAGRRLTYVGDGNNVAHALMEAGARLGCNVTVITPAGHEPDDDHLRACVEAGGETGATIEVSNDLAAIAGSDAVYTDVWASMGQEDEAEARYKTFEPYRIDMNVMNHAGEDAIFMHCLPAHRGDEVTDEVADSPRSVIFQEAENRLHAQKALMLLLMG